MSALAEGQKVFEQRYTLMKIVGRSPTSIVWLAWDQKQDKDVALKFLPEMVKEDGSAVATLKREIRKLQEELKHPPIVQIHDLECSGTMVAIVSEYVEGASLTELREQKPNKVFAPQELGDWLQQLIAVLSHAHSELGVSHGDLTTANLIITKKGTLRVTGFCMAPYINEFLTRTGNPGAVTANLTYYSPQRAAGAPNNYLDDIYAVGTILYELLTSKPPFYTGDIMLQVQHKVPPPMVHRRKELRVIGEPISRIWEETIAALLAKDPAQRPQNVQDLIARMEIEAAPTADVQEAAPPPPPPNNKPMVIAVVVVFVLVATVGLLLGKKDKGGTKVVEKIVEKQETAEEKAKRAAEKKTADDAVAKAKKLAQDMEKLKADEAKRVAEAKKAKEESEKMAKAEAQKRAEAEANFKAQQAAFEKQKREAEEDLKKKLASSTNPQDKKAAEEAIQKAEAAAKKAKDDLEATIAKMKKDEVDRKKKEEIAAAEAEKKKKANDAQMAAIAQAQEIQRKQAETAKQQEILMAKAKEDETRLKQEAAKKAADEKAKAETFASKKFTAGKPWENTIGIRLLPVGKVAIAAYETRLADFDAFVREKKYNAGNAFKSPGFRQDNDGHPVVNVSWKDAKEFCAWLTEKEVKAGLLPADYAYRLPTDSEWSQAVSLDSEAGATPTEKASRSKGIFPWGNTWPPPPGAGNYTDRLTYDQYENTAPVGSFKPNKMGLFDMGGNVWEWCEDWSDSSQKNRVLRGGSFYSLIFSMGEFEAGARRSLGADERKNDCGFRVVLDKK